MRILHIVDQTVRLNGMAHAAVDLACAQADQGHEVYICYAYGSFENILRKHQVIIHEIKQLGRAPLAPLTIARLFFYVKKIKPDVIHVHMIAAALLSWPIAKLLRIPLVTCVQNSFSKFSILMKIGDRVITGSNAVADDMEKRGISKSKLRPILNGTIGSARQESGEASLLVIKRPAVITICGLHPRKGVIDLIRGFEKARNSIPELYLYIVGEGPHEGEYKDSVMPEHRDYVEFCGPCDDTRPFLQAADVFVLASLADPAPLILSEARDVGIAIIATNVDGIPELLDYGKAGILINPRSPCELAGRLIDLLENPSELNKWKQKSLDNNSNLSVRRVAEQTVIVYNECVKAHN